MAPNNSGGVLKYFLLGIAIIALFFLAFALLIPHRTGVVTSVGKISRYTAHSGTGIHRSEHIRYASDVRVRVKDSNKMETIYYRVANPLDIPNSGDEVVFASYPLTGNGPYPQMWAVRLGATMLAADVVVAAIYCLWRRKRVSRSPAVEDSQKQR